MHPHSDLDRSPLILASGSPRRRFLLHAAGIEFEIRPAGIPEARREGEHPAAMATRLATEKALAVARGVGAGPPRWVLGADTIVVLGDEVLGKPDDAEHAVALLRQLSGRRHRVITGIGVVESGTLASWSRSVESEVSIRDATEPEIRAYVAGGEPMDKAGAYALQGEGRRFVAGVTGSETNVIGLPMDETLELLRQVGALAEGGDAP